VHGAEHLHVDAVGDVVGVVHAGCFEHRRQRLQALGHRPPQSQPRSLRDALAQLARRSPHERQRAVEEGRVAQPEVRERLRAAPEPVGGLARPGDGSLELAVQLVEVVGDGEDEQLLLGGELPVDQPSGDPDRPRDLLDRRVLHAPRVEQGAGGDDELSLAALSD
jgi:hypothetical protein